MSTLEDRTSSKPDAEALEARYQASVAHLRKNRMIEQGQAGALVYAALAFKSALETKSFLATASHLAKLFCIAALFVIPNLLVLHVLL